jgi:SAM-dependent methyltransferase
MINFWNRLFKKPNWHALRSTQPISRVFGLDRGLPVDRYYIEQFLSANKNFIKGHAIEIADDMYTRKFGTGVTHSDILHVDTANKRATVVGDLTKPQSLPQDAFDCFICTQTLNFVFDLHAAVRGIHKVLKPGGTVLATAAGICQISRYDMDRWGDYWRFTTKSVEQLFAGMFGSQNVTVAAVGNVLSAIALLEGLAASELTTAELDYHDPDYQVVITVRATK